MPTWPIQNKGNFSSSLVTLLLYPLMGADIFRESFSFGRVLIRRPLKEGKDGL